MSLSHEAKMIDDVAIMIRKVSGELQGTLPHAAMTLGNIAISVGQAGEMYERARVDAIIKGTHPALLPVKRLLLIQSRTDRSYDKFLRGDFALQELRVGHVDETELAKRHQSSQNEFLFKRFVGVMLRRIYAKRGIEQNVQALSLFPTIEDEPGIPTGVYVFEGDVVIQFPDAAQAFEHSLTFGKHYAQHNSNSYKIRSLWLNEEFLVEFNSLGWMWLQKYVMAPVSISHNIQPSDYECISSEEMLELVKAIPDVSNTLLMFHHITMYYPGSSEEFLPKCRVDVTHHYYAGSDNYQLTINVHPDENHVALGLEGGPQRNQLDFKNSPTPIQKWIKENIEAAMLAKVAEVKAEAEANK